MRLRTGRLTAKGACVSALVVGGLTHLPASAAAETIRTDLDGDGVGETVAVGTLRDASGIVSGITVAATLSASGVQVARSWPAFGVEGPLVRRVGNVDGRPGAELVLRTLHLSNEEQVRFYTLVGATLTRTRSLLTDYSLSDYYASGFRCTSVRGRPGVLAFHFARLTPGRWRRYVRTFVWYSGALSPTGRTRTTVVRSPPAGERQPGCGRPPHLVARLAH